MIFFQQFFLDREKDIAVDLLMEGDHLYYVIRTPNHHSGNLITNLARLCSLQTVEDENRLLVIRGEVPCYFDGENRRMYIFRLGNTKVANIFPDGRVELKASIPAISKTLMSQTKDYRLGIEKTIVKTYIRSECKFRTDLHTHMNGNLPPDVLIALGIIHQIRYPYYYIKKLGLGCTLEQIAKLETRRQISEIALGETTLTGRHRERRIDDLTFINFADLILGNPKDAADNIAKIRSSLTIPKDGQAVFADLEKVYLYRYVFTRGIPADDPFAGINLAEIPDRDVLAFAERMRRDHQEERYRQNTLYQDLLLWIAREYQKHGIVYAEISDTAFLNPSIFPDRLRQIHEVMPAVTRETGVLLRFLAAIRRIPLSIIRDSVTPGNYLAENLRCLRLIADDPYIAGSDIVGEEINDIQELRGTIRELVAIAADHPGFVIRIHAGENDSLRDNVANSLRCVRESLGDGQPMPPLRIGHGLYTCDLRSAKGKRLLEELRTCGATLEFQITSNVRLNNLSRLDRHPLRQYLSAGISCVQGTDGGALYGTNSIDEELSLEKLLGLRMEELCQMRQAEEAILEESLRVFREKSERRTSLPDPAQARSEGLQEHNDLITEESASAIDAEEALRDQLAARPDHLFPIVVAGGSFSDREHRSRVRAVDRVLLDTLLHQVDPEKACFVVGHTLTGQEGYLVRKAAGRFAVYAIVPNRINRGEFDRLTKSGVRVLVSIESTYRGLYKSFAYEIFSRMPSALLAFDGNSAVLNLIQEARNARYKCRIYISQKNRGLAAKAQMLEGYVSPLFPFPENLFPVRAE